MSKQSKFKIRDLKVKSFITGSENIVGGNPSLLVCDFTVDWTPNRHTFGPYC